MSGDDPITLQWYKDDVPLISSSKLMINTISSRMSLLIIQSAGSEHSGTYSCKAFNPVGQAEFSASLEVMEKPAILPFAFPVEVQEGQLLQVTCTVTTGDEPVTLQWYKDSQPLTPSAKFMINDITSKMSLLVLQEVGSDHTGSYECHAYNPVGRATYSAVLKVNEKPEILPFDFPREVKEGQLLQLSCTVTTGDDPVTLQWYKDDIPVISSAKFMINKVDSKMSFLILRDVGLDHTGTYTCLAFNPVGQQKFSAQLWVNAAPVIMPFMIPPENFEGVSIQILCTLLSGDDPVTLYWLKDKISMNTDSLDGTTINNVGSRTSMLAIPSVEQQHSGEYTCVASNRAGQANHSVILNVLVPPRIIPFHFEEHIRAGSLVQVICVVGEGDSPIDIRWTLHGEEVRPKLGIFTQRVGERTSILSIDRVGSEHRGSYTCLASNHAGQTNHTETLWVNEPPQIRPFQFEPELLAGQDTQLQCYVVHGDPPLNIMWYFQGKEVSNMMGRKLVTRTTGGERQACSDFYRYPDVAHPLR
ncbi:Titin [Portunus trituberculatus]|uniref:Titin n=1 Tax=Portunus trituberculatus TaxID=210409 RepID=A0A5B7FIK3_PORTR|nr:Titin [Portunus trituberculatus]